MHFERCSGILLPIRSLPSKWGIGDIGDSAKEFLDFLNESNQKIWQILPVLSYPLKGYSPYSSVSAFAGNILLISPEILERDGFLKKKDLKKFLKNVKNSEFIDYKNVLWVKRKILEKAYEHFKLEKIFFKEFNSFCRKNRFWLDDFASFVVFYRYFGKENWFEWPKFARDKTSKISFLKKELKEEINKEEFFQFLFYRQWFLLRDYSNKRGIKLFGDIPIYVDYNSSDVWSNPHIFKLDRKTKKMKFVSGAPPDYFSENGQLWGNPVYNWKTLRNTFYKWWILRVKHSLKMYDLLRIDHFRGFVAYWEVSAKSRTAKNGKWVKAPVYDFLKKLKNRFHKELPIIAEDLGYITDDVREVMRKFELPGMKVLMFAFDGNPNNPYLLHNHTKNSVVYTGTHDNNTVVGWFRKEAGKVEKENLSRYAGINVTERNVADVFIRFAMMSPSNICIIPFQDILGLNEKARINKPSTIRNNWIWKLNEKYLNKYNSIRLKTLTEIYGRK